MKHETTVVGDLTFLKLDLFELLAKTPNHHSFDKGIWRRFYRRLPVWEDFVDKGLVIQKHTR